MTPKEEKMGIFKAFVKDTGQTISTLDLNTFESWLIETYLDIYATQKVQEEREKIYKWVKLQRPILRDEGEVYYSRYKKGMIFILDELKQFLSKQPEAEKVQEDGLKECSTCKYNELNLAMNPCITCNASLHYWQPLPTKPKEG